MHNFFLPQKIVEQTIARRGRLHAYENLESAKTALLVVDMQNAFVEKGAGHAWVPTAAATCPNINKIAHTLRASGGTIVWLLNTFTEESLRSWSHFHEYLSSPEGLKRRSESMREGSPGHQLYEALDTKPTDLFVPKTRYSAFIQGSSELEKVLRDHRIDTILITGTATNVCCESTARDGMMLNFRTLMISDACSASTDEAHAASLCSFITNFGDVQTTDEIMAMLHK